jgi:hypothetical protein
MPTPINTFEVIDGKRHRLLDSYTWESRGSGVSMSEKDRNTVNQLVRRFQSMGYTVRRKSWVTPMRGGNITTTHFYGRKGK